MPRKPPGRAVDPRNGQRSTISRTPLARFEPPTDLSEESVDVWNSYWDDPVSSVLTIADKGTLIRWIEMVDQRAELMRQAKLDPVTLGSTKQKQANPLFGVSMTLEKAIQSLEAQLGIGPKNRAALGIAVMSEQRSLADLNAEFEGLDDSEEDPRLIQGSLE